MYRGSYSGIYDDDTRCDDDRDIAAVSSVGEAKSAACARLSCDSITPLETSSMINTANIIIAKKDSDYRKENFINDIASYCKASYLVFVLRISNFENIADVYRNLRINNYVS